MTKKLPERTNERAKHTPESDATPKRGIAAGTAKAEEFVTKELTSNGVRVVVTLAATTDPDSRKGIFVTDYSPGGDLEKTVFIKLGDFLDKVDPKLGKESGEWIRDRTFSLHGRPVIVMDE